MIKILENWITTVLCIGIFLTFIQMIVPNTKLKSYIYSLIGVITIITLVMPVANYLKTNQIEEVTQSVLNNIEIESQENFENDSTKNYDYTKENLKNEFTKKIKEDIKQKLELKGIKSEMISVIVSDEYVIQKINIKLNKNNANLKNDISTIFLIIKENYNVDMDRIIVEEM